ncbi:MAG: sugar O-acetyltransferase [Cyanobacteriota bacterium]|nr:sugar O-acetyltransferase [Cyanobacteriota bacterium]
MLSGELYLASDPELVQARQRASHLIRLYNNTYEDQGQQRYDLLKELLGRVGSQVNITPPFYCDYGSHILLGERFYSNFGCVILDCHWVEIGDDVLLAPYVQIYAAYHPTDPQLRLTGQELAGSVKIGNNVWIGGGAIITQGVTIGDNTTIGAGSVVVKDIPANVIAVGNPCRVIRQIAG